jgi:hypothetical protein
MDKSVDDEVLLKWTDSEMLNREFIHFLISVPKQFRESTKFAVKCKVEQLLTHTVLPVSVVGSYLDVGPSSFLIILTKKFLIKIWM